MKSIKKTKFSDRFIAGILLLILGGFLLMLLDDDPNWVNFFKHLIKNILRNVF
ncbi:MAG: hypothetical protein JJ885_04025 [Muricauda sp.]|nr:hypothetical protein [Allomuricauda sp.]MBO6532745.1 hypothetical protein [Allomuricauda sp.]MBO6588974.1 hypothetical protein [Allomuricauda sp.]MBO6618599.1 hypothetical protein [Allomuricauda sp.]MBO6644512.1 hypothetical protein [Allomuricauda sp.]MBO6746412.1 hypothetical protein [Allomuricauda sp.]